MAKEETLKYINERLETLERDLRSNFATEEGNKVMEILINELKTIKEKLKGEKQVFKELGIDIVKP